MKNIPVFLKYALHITLAVIFISVVLWLTNLAGTDTGNALEILFLLVYIFGIVLAMKEEKQNQNGYINYWQAFKVGLFAMLIASVFISIYRFVDYEYINHERFAEQKERTREAGTEASEMISKWVEIDEDELQEKLDEQIAAQTPAKTARDGFFGLVFTGVILSLIIAAFIRKDPPPLTENQQDSDYSPYHNKPDSE